MSSNADTQSEEGQVSQAIKFSNQGGHISAVKLTIMLLCCKPNPSTSRSVVVVVFMPNSSSCADKGRGVSQHGRDKAAALARPTHLVVHGRFETIHRAVHVNLGGVWAWTAVFVV